MSCKRQISIFSSFIFAKKSCLFSFLARPLQFRDMIVILVAIEMSIFVGIRSGLHDVVFTICGTIYKV